MVADDKDVASVLAPSLTERFLTGVDRLLATADCELAQLYPGDPGTRQPVHTVYVSAADADIDTPHRWGTAALDLLDAHAAGADAAAAVTGLAPCPVQEPGSGHPPPRPAHP